MAINQLRRDPVSGIWTIIIQDKTDIKELAGNKRARGGGKAQSAERCQFCEGNEAETPSEIQAFRYPDARRNEPGWRVRVIPDKYPVLRIEGELNNRGVGIYDVLDGIGANEIVIETPKHFETLITLTDPHVEEVLRAYRERILDLKQDARFRYVLVYKNYGEATGPTVNHSYSYVIATPITPMRVKDELMCAMEYYQYKERCLFCDIIRQELAEGERVVAEDSKFLAFAPFASRAPFEIWILPQTHETFFEWNSNYYDLAKMLRFVLSKISDILNDPNYVMAIHTGPNLTAGRRRGYWRTLEKDYHWHMEIVPRVRGFTSFEIGSGIRVNQVAPERAASIMKSEKKVTKKKRHSS